MRLMRNFPALRLIAEGEKDAEIAPDFSDARAIHAKDLVPAACDLAAEASVELVALIEPHVAPAKEAGSIAVDQVLCDSGVAIRYPAKSVVTGLHVPRGVVLMPVSMLEVSNGDLLRPKLTAPHAIGAFTGNRTPELAFETGFEIASDISESSRDIANTLALSASLGTDALNGCWWILGALAGLLRRDTLGDAWTRHEVLLSRPREIQRHIAAEARRVRLETGWPVCALSQDQSRVMKAMLPAWPAEDIWLEFISGCRALGSGGDALADRYQRAVKYIWPGGA